MTNIANFLEYKFSFISKSNQYQIKVTCLHFVAHLHVRILRNCVGYDEALETTRIYARYRRAGQYTVCADSINLLCPCLEKSITKTLKSVEFE